MHRAVYCTRESVMNAPDIRASAYVSEQIDDAVCAGADAVDKLMHRTFYPWLGTREFDWPGQQDAGSYRLWFDKHDLISASSITVAGADLTGSIFLEPIASGPPYTHMDIDRATGAAFTYAEGIGQRSISVTGLWGYQNTERTLGTVALDYNSSAETVQYTPSARVAGVGHTIRSGNERMLVSGKRWLDSGQTATLAANAGAVVVAVSDGTAFLPGEELMIGSEFLLVVAVAGNSLMVRRAWAGSTLAAHSVAALYWPRELEVERGALGTTATAGTQGDAMFVHEAPRLIAQLNRAYAIDQFFQEGTGYARVVGQDDNLRQVSGRGMRELEEKVYGAYGRRYRFRAV